jgi:hypothetical protein
LEVTKKVFLFGLAMIAAILDVKAERLYGDIDPISGWHEMVSQRVLVPGEVVYGRMRLGAERFSGCYGGEGLYLSGSARLAEKNRSVDDLRLGCKWDASSEEWVVEYSFRVPNGVEGQQGLYFSTGAGDIWPVLGGVRLHVLGAGDAHDSVRSMGIFTNLVQDPGFEAGPGSISWHESSTNFGTPICSIADCGSLIGDGAYSGEYWVWFGGAKVEETGVVSQQVVMPVADYLDLDFYLQIPDASEKGYFKVFVDNEELFQATEADFASFPAYRRVLLGLGEYADGASHELRFEGYVEGASPVRTSFFLDEVALVEKSSGDVCQADGVVISDVVVGGGMNRIESVVSIVSEGNVLIGGDGVLELAAPEVRLGDGFHASAGSSLRIETAVNGCL